MASPVFGSVFTDVGTLTGVAVAKVPNTATMSAALGSIIVFHIMVETISPTNCPTVSSIAITSGTGAMSTPALRADSGQFSSMSSVGGTDNGRMFIYWSRVTTALASAQITVTMSANFDDIKILADTWTGCVSSGNPFDPNVGLPLTAQDSLTSTTSPSHTYSTTNADDMLLITVGTCDGSTITVPTGWTAYQTTINDPSGSGEASITGGDKSVSTVQTSVSVTYTDSGGNGSKAIVYIDALTADSAAANNPFFETDWPNPVAPVRVSQYWAQWSQLTNNQILMPQALL